MTQPIPRLCVVVPVLNERSFLKQSLDSLFAQDHPNMEVRLYDGGSKDGSLEIAKQYACNLVVHPGLGQMAAINAGWKSTEAEFVTWWAGDDVYRPGALRRLTAVLQGHPAAGFVHADADLIDAQDRRIGRVTPGRIALESLVLGFKMMPQSTVIRKHSLLKAGMLDESLRLAADWDLFLRISQYYPSVYVPFVASARRLHEGSEDAQAGVAGAEAACRVLMNFFDRRDLTEDQQLLHPKAIATCWGLRAWAAAKSGQKGQSLKAILRAERTWFGATWRIQACRKALRIVVLPSLDPRLVSWIRRAALNH